MAYKDFRDFLSTLEKEGQLLTISEEVKLNRILHLLEVR